MANWDFVAKSVILYRWHKRCTVPSGFSSILLFCKGGARGIEAQYHSSNQSLVHIDGILIVFFLFLFFDMFRISEAMRAKIMRRTFMIQYYLLEYT